MASERDKVVSNLKACVVSAPGGGVPATYLNNDYKSLVGEPIPYKRLGYATLEDLLKNLPEFDVVKKEGQWFVKAKMIGGSSHISKLVLGQKKSAKKPRKSRFLGKFNRPAPSKFIPPPRYVPHFLSSPTNTKQPVVKPKAQYISPAPVGSHVSPPKNDSSSFGGTDRHHTASVGQNASSGYDKPKPVAYHPPLLPNPPQIRAPLLPTPQIPMRAPPAPLLPSLKKAVPIPKSTVADRLMKHKKDETVSTTSGTPSVNSTKVNNNDYPDVIPSNTTVNGAQWGVGEIKWIDPVKSKKSLQKKESTEDVQPFQYDEKSYVFILNRYASSQNWPRPEYFMLNLKVGNQKHSRNQYICRVCVYCSQTGAKSRDGVDCHEYSSYPEEFPDVSQAMYFVAKKAYDSLLKKNTIKLPVTPDYDLILGRVSEMVEGKDQGVWMYQIENMYKDKYNESLPQNLPSILAQSQTLELSKLAESYYIVRPKARAESAKYFSPNFVSHLTISKLTYPAEESWDVFVSKVKSLNEIYIRIIGDQYSLVYETMSAEMDLHYLHGKPECPAGIEVGMYCALVTQDSSFRVLITGCSGQHFQVYLIDVGDVDFVERSALRVLLPKFYAHPAQAIPCFLDDLASYDFALSNPELNNTIFDLVLARSFASLVSNRDPVQLTLFDTEKEEDINVNTVIKKIIDSSFCTPDLFEEGILKEIHVVTVDTNGQVYVQVPSWTLNCLKETITLIGNGHYEVSYVRNVKRVVKDKIYIWNDGPARVKVTDVDLNGEVHVDFIDTGGRKVVYFNELYEIEQLGNILSKIPHQAVPVLLHDVNDGTLKPNQVQKFLDLVNSNSECPTIGKSISFVSEVPVIEIFVRNVSSNLLVSVNQNLTLNDDMASRMGLLSFDQTSTFSVSTTNHAESVLQKFTPFPKIDQELDVFVSGIASPSNFTVRPVVYLKFLNSMSEEMMIFYSVSSNDVYLPHIGEAVAACVCGAWYRVMICQKMGNGMYSGRYLDHGHMDVFPAEDIRVLYDKFKKLPFLACKAQIHGIKPKNGDWDVTDCLRVREFLQNKKVVSFVRAIHQEPDGKKLSLEIIDTSTPLDICIASLLIEEGRAIKY